MSRTYKIVSNTCTYYSLFFAERRVRSMKRRADDGQQAEDLKNKKTMRKRVVSRRVFVSPLRVKTTDRQLVRLIFIVDTVIDLIL